MPATASPVVTSRALLNIQNALLSMQNYGKPSAAPVDGAAPALDPALLAAAPVPPRLAQANRSLTAAVSSAAAPSFPPPVVVSGAPPSLPDAGPPETVPSAPAPPAALEGAPATPDIVNVSNYELPPPPVRKAVGDLPVRDVRGDARKAAQSGLWAGGIAALLGGGVEGALTGATAASGSVRALQNAEAEQEQAVYANAVKAADADFKAEQANWADSLKARQFEEATDNHGATRALTEKGLAERTREYDTTRGDKNEKAAADTALAVGKHNIEQATAGRAVLSALSNLSPEGRQAYLKSYGDDNLAAAGVTIAKTADGAYDIPAMFSASDAKQATARADASDKAAASVVHDKLAQYYKIYADNRTTPEGRTQIGKTIFDLEQQQGVAGDSPLKASLLSALTPAQARGFALQEKRLTLDAQKAADAKRDRERREALRAASVFGSGKGGDGDLLKVAGRVTSLRNRMGVVNGKITTLREKGALTTSEAATLKALRSEKFSLNQESGLLRQKVGKAGASLFAEPGPDTDANPLPLGGGDAAHHLIEHVKALATDDSASVARLPTKFLDDITGISKMGGKFTLTVPHDVDTKNPFVLIQVGGKGGRATSPEYAEVVRLAEQSGLQVGYSKARKSYVLQPKGAAEVSAPASKPNTVKAKSGRVWSYSVGGH